MEHSKEENIALGINYALKTLVLIFNIIVIVYTLFVWKRRNFVIQSTVWLSLIACVIMMVEDLLLYFSTDVEPYMTTMEFTWQAFLFASHLILVT